MLLRAQHFTVRLIQRISTSAIFQNDRTERSHAMLLVGKTWRTLRSLIACCGVIAQAKVKLPVILFFQASID